MASLAAAPSTTTAFDVVSVKKWTTATGRSGLDRAADGEFDRSRTTVASLMEFAFDIREYQIIGGPDWIRRDNFAVHARAEKSASLAQMRTMVQALLVERFQLRTRHEQREMPVFALTLTDRRKSQRGLVPRDEAYCRNRPLPSLPNMPPGAMRLSGCGSLDTLATMMISPLLRAPVINRTGLTGTFEYSVIHSRDGLPLLARPVEPQLQPSASDPNLPSLFDAIREQVGLTLERSRAPVSVIVIDAIQQPAGN